MSDPFSNTKSARAFLNLSDWFHRYDGMVTIHHCVELLSCAKQQDADLLTRKLSGLCAEQRVPFPYHCLGQLLDSLGLHRNGVGRILHVNPFAKSRVSLSALATIS
jgi:hypothetical protein